MELSVYYFYVKTNISIDFQICISVPDKLSISQELWLCIKNEKFISNFHPHTKSSGLNIRYLLWLLIDKFCKMNQWRNSPSFHKFYHLRKIAAFLRLCKPKSRKNPKKNLSTRENWYTVLEKIKSEEKCMLKCSNLKPNS